MEPRARQGTARSQVAQNSPIGLIRLKPRSLGVVLVNKLRERVTFSLTVHRNLIFLVAIIGISLPSSGQDFQTTGKLLARTGPSESYPIAAELPISTRVTKVTEDPNGWIAVRTADGQIVWLPKGDFTSNSAILTTIPPLGPQTNPPESGIKTERGYSVSNAVLLTSGNNENASGVGGHVARASAEPDGWRPATAGGLSFSPRYDRTPRDATGQRNDGFGNVSQHTPNESVERVLDEVDQELSTLLARDPTLWQVSPLQDKLAALAGKPLTAQQIERIDALAQKLATARRIADLSRRVQSPHQPVAENITVPGSVAREVPGPVAGPAGIPSNLGWTMTGMNSATLSTLVPPPGTRIPVESRTAGLTERNLSVGISQTQPHPGAVSSANASVQPSEISPASFEVNPTGQLVEVTSPSHLDRSDQELSTQTNTNPAPTSSLREEIARELNDLRRERFDAVGRLVKAQVRRPTDPPYVVLNESGNVVCYVKPSPGTLLRTYVGHWVGITGRKSRLPDGRGPLITAESLRLLDPPEETAQR